MKILHKVVTEKDGIRGGGMSPNPAELLCKYVQTLVYIVQIKAVG